MKLDIIAPKIEKSNNFEEKFFSIGDYGMVFEILRSKMYSNPIASICREISCNARDSHIEANKSNVAIQITIPNDLDPNYKIKDYGVGISPDRIEHIFIKFGASTKRETNEQVGSFGLGCKSPFGYTDTFTVATNFDGTHYNYACYIDETNVGKCALLSKEPTSEPNGTEIIIPVKSKDFNSFKDATEFTTRHWNIKPIIKGGKIEYKSLNKIVSGNGWSVVENKDSYGYYTTDNKIKLIIDGIEYPIDTAQLKDFASNTIFSNFEGDLYLYFDTGTISISTNREQIHIDDKTKNNINNKLDQIQNELKTSILKQINELPTLFDVYKYIGNGLTKNVRDLSFIFPFTYKDVEITKSTCKISEFADVRIFTLNKAQKPMQYIAHSSTLSIDANIDTYINDLGMTDVSAADVSSAFINDVKKVQIITPKASSSYDEMFVGLHLDKMGFKLLSTLPIKEKKTRQTSGTRITIFKLDEYGRYCRKSMEDFKADTNRKIMCSLSRNEFNNKRSYRIKQEGVFIEIDDILLNLITKDKNISIYGIDNSIPSDKLKKEFTECIIPEKYIEELLVGHSKQDIAKIKVASSQHTYDRQLNALTDIAQHIKNKNSNSLFYKYLELYSEIKTLTSKNNLALIEYYKIINSDLNEEIDKFKKNNLEFDLKSLKNKIQATYPLVYLDDYGYYNQETKDIAHYINLMDADLKKG